MSSSRFILLSPISARVLLAALALFIVLGTLLTSNTTPIPIGKPGQGDAALYRAIAAHTALSPTLTGYYSSAVQEQRMRGYPLKPFITVREPALALLNARVGNRGTIMLFRLLSLLTLTALVLRLRQSQHAWVSASALTALNIALLAQPALVAWHEAWAALLVALSLACRSERHWIAACAIGLIAALFREFCAIYLLAMVFAAFSEQRRDEALGWSAALVAFILLLITHSQMVAKLIIQTDLSSPGWTGLGGWHFILSMTRESGALSLLPPWASAIFVPLALVGWASRANSFCDRVTLTLFGWVLPFTLIGRPDNFYWGLMFAPLLLAGLAFAPRALADLSRSTLATRRPLPA